VSYVTSSDCPVLEICWKISSDPSNPPLYPRVSSALSRLTCPPASGRTKTVKNLGWAWEFSDHASIVSFAEGRISRFGELSSCWSVEDSAAAETTPRASQQAIAAPRTTIRRGYRGSLERVLIRILSDLSWGCLVESPRGGQ